MQASLTATMFSMVPSVVSQVTGRGAAANGSTFATAVSSTGSHADLSPSSPSSASSDASAEPKSAPKCASMAKRCATTSSEALASTFVASPYNSRTQASPAVRHYSMIAEKKCRKTTKPSRSRMRFRLG